MTNGNLLSLVGNHRAEPGDLDRAVPGTRVSIIDKKGEFVAVAEIRADRRLWPLRVLPRESI